MIFSGTATGASRPEAKECLPPASSILEDSLRSATPPRPLSGPRRQLVANRFPKTYPFPYVEKAETGLRSYPFLNRRREYRTFGEAAGRGLRGSVACIAGARHTTLSPLLTSLGTFLFSHKKVPPPAGILPHSRSCDVFSAFGGKKEPPQRGGSFGLLIPFGICFGVIHVRNHGIHVHVRDAVLQLHVIHRAVGDGDRIPRFQLRFTC